MRLCVDCVWSVDVFIDEDSRRCVVVLWVEVLVTVVSHWAPSGPEKTLEISFSVKIQGGEFNVLPGPENWPQTSRRLLSFRVT